jgi:adenosylhomocysteine nucleosidase
VRWQESLLTKIIILTATRVELNAVGRVLPRVGSIKWLGHAGLESHDASTHVLIIQTGIGPDKARSVTRKILEKDAWDVVISTGFAGALNSSLIGSLVIGQEVLIMEQSGDFLSDWQSQSIECHPGWVKASLGMQDRIPLQCGRFVTTDRVLTQASQKRLLWERTQALAVDMESAAIGQVAKQNGLPFLIVRSISDGINEDLPVDFNVFLKPFGWVEGVGQVLFTPRCWKGFFRLYRNSRQAGIQLSNFFEFFFANVFQPTFSNPITKSDAKFS